MPGPVNVLSTVIWNSPRTDRQVISVAHPDHRDELAAAAWDLHRIRV